MEPCHCQNNFVVVVRRCPKLVLPAAETPHTVCYLPPVVDAFKGFASIVSSHMLLFEGKPQWDGQPPHAHLARGLEKALVSYYPLAGRLRAVGVECGAPLELVCSGQGAVFVEAQANISLAQLKQTHQMYLSQLQYDHLYAQQASTDEVPPFVIQVTTLTCGGFVINIRVVRTLLDSAGMLHFLHAWSEMTKATHTSVALTMVPIWGGMMPTQLGPWPQRFHFPSLHLTHAQEEYAYDQKYLSSEPKDQPFFENMHSSSTISISLEALCKLKDSFRLKCNKFEALAAMFWRERVRALALHPSSEVILFFPAPMAQDAHLAFYGQYAFNCMVMMRAGDLIQSDLTGIVQIIKEASKLLDVKFMECIKKFYGVHCSTKRAPPHVFLFTTLWDGIQDFDFGMGSTTPYVPDGTHLHSSINVATITQGLEGTIDIAMTNAPLNMEDNINLLFLPTHPLMVSDSRL